MSNKNISTKALDTVAPAPLTPVDVAKAMLEQKKSTSDIIRALSKICVKTDGDTDRGAITKALKESGVRTKNGTEVKYQHVRNTLITPVKKTQS